MTERNLRTISIVGGEISAWIVAAALSRYLAGQPIAITVVEPAGSSDTEGALSTVPSISGFHRGLQISESDLLSAGHGDYKLGTAYQDWIHRGQRSVHTFSPAGSMLDGVEFHHYLTRLRQSGGAPNLQSFSVTAVAAEQQRFGLVETDPQSPLAKLVYALHLDQQHYVRVLRQHALASGVVLLDAKLEAAELDPDSGFVRTLTLDNGRTHSADFFFDCSGPAALLAGRDLETDFEDWSHWLPPMQRLVITNNRPSPRSLLTRLQRHPTGWSRTIPLAGRQLEQYWFSDEFQSLDAVHQQLSGDSPDQSVSQSAQRATSGCRRRFWSKNCVAIGAAAGFIGDFVIDSTPLIQSATLRWLDLFPDRHCDERLANQYNRATREEYERVLDTHLLHLMQAASSQPDSPFWRAIADIQWPESLRYRVELFAQTGKLAFYEGDSLAGHAWISLLDVLGVQPQRHDPLAAAVVMTVLEQRLEAMQQAIEQAVQTLPSHHH